MNVDRHDQKDKRSKEAVASRRSCVGSVLEKLVIGNALRENFVQFAFVFPTN